MSIFVRGETSVHVDNYYKRPTIFHFFGSDFPLLIRPTRQSQMFYNCKWTRMLFQLRENDMTASREPSEEEKIR
jgi:hypothetical protein